MTPCPPAEALLGVDRSDARAARSVSEHVAACDDCLERLALLRALGIRIALDARSWPEATDCPDAFEIAAFAEGGLRSDEAATTRTHVGSCERCLESLDAALTEIRATAPAALASLAATETATGPGTGLMTRLRHLFRPTPAMWAPLSAALVLALVWIVRPTGDGFEDLARIEPIELRATRGDDATSDAAAARDAYIEGRFAEAADAYAALSAADPTDVDARLMLGSSWLLSGDPDRAARELTAVLDAATGARRRTALWHRAQARLLLEDRTGAVTDLTELAQSSGRHRDDAAEQLSVLVPAGSAPND